MKIALLISGRAARYEVCLLPILESCKNDYEIHLFMSINDDDALYYKCMRENLKNYLKDIYIKKYSLPENFKYTHTGSRWNMQKINGEYMPYNIMSMFWNDHNAFEMAVKYSEDNKIKYDIFMKFRSDITKTSLPKVKIIDENEYHLYCVNPIVSFISNGIYKEPIVCIDCAWGNYKSMKVYCNTINYVLQKNKETDGTYFICLESSATDNIVENKLPYSFVNNSYKLDMHRRIFDKTFERNEQGEIIGGDIRQGQLSGCHNYIDPNTVSSTKNIVVVPII
jgi:hypothetical protein